MFFFKCMRSRLDYAYSIYTYNRLFTFSEVCSIGIGFGKSPAVTGGLMLWRTVFSNDASGRIVCDRPGLSCRLVLLFFFLADEMVGVGGAVLVAVLGVGAVVFVAVGAACVVAYVAIAIIYK